MLILKVFYGFWVCRKETRPPAVGGATFISWSVIIQELWPKVHKSFKDSHLQTSSAFVFFINRLGYQVISSHLVAVNNNNNNCVACSASDATTACTEWVHIHFSLHVWEL